MPATVMCGLLRLMRGMRAHRRRCGYDDNRQDLAGKVAAGLAEILQLSDRHEHPAGTPPNVILEKLSLISGRGVHVG